MTNDNTHANKVKVLELPADEVVSISTTRGKALADLGHIVLQSVQRAVKEINRFTEQEEVILEIVLPKVQIRSSDE